VNDFRAALMQVPPHERDAWVDRYLGIDHIPDDTAELPRGCVPYLPCGVDKLLQVAEHVRADDVFVDVGSGIGRALAFVHLMTGAEAIGIEIQSELVRASRALAKRVNAERISVIEGDATQPSHFITRGTVFFLYCPFSGERLARFVDDLRAMKQRFRVCCVDVTLPRRDWLEEVSSGDVVVYRSR
jgi:SAM-dependent methyltransferase